MILYLGKFAIFGDRCQKNMVNGLLHLQISFNLFITFRLYKVWIVDKTDNKDFGLTWSYTLVNLPYLVVCTNKYIFQGPLHLQISLNYFITFRLYEVWIVDNIDKRFSSVIMLYLGKFAIYVNLAKNIYIYSKNRYTYTSNFVLKRTGNHKFILDFCRNKTSKINSFQVIKKWWNYPFHPSFLYAPHLPLSRWN